MLDLTFDGPILLSHTRPTVAHILCFSLTKTIKYYLLTMTNFSNALRLLVIGALAAPSTAFAPASFGVSQKQHFQLQASTAADATDSEVTKLTGKPTGTSFLPEETLERAKAGSNIEKIKMAKDGTAAFVDVYEYARKIREGEMSWEEVEKSDLDNVSVSEVETDFSPSPLFLSKHPLTLPHYSD
jgi:hypothetical protein